MAKGNETVLDFLTNSQGFFVATVEDGQPRVRPFTSVIIFEDELYLMTGKAKDVAEQLEENSRIEISSINGDEWLRFEANAEADDRVEIIEAMLETYPMLQGQYEPNDGNALPLKLINKRASICSFTHEPIEVEF